MKTCNDCLHYDVCKALEDQVPMIDARQCGCYKDKSCFIELPCKVGDTVYIDLSDKGDYYDECKVKHIEFNSDWTEPLLTFICYEKADYRTYWLSDFGKEWFLEPTERKKKKRRKTGEKGNG